MPESRTAKSFMDSKASVVLWLFALVFHPRSTFRSQNFSASRFPQVFRAVHAKGEDLIVRGLAFQHPIGQIRLLRLILELAQIPVVAVNSKQIRFANAFVLQFGFGARETNSSPCASTRKASAPPSSRYLLTAEKLLQ